MTKLGIKLFDFLASLKLAVILILSVAVIGAIGTFVEAESGADEAKRIVYGSWWMSTVLVLLVVNVLFAALSRLPWRKHHVGFVITHLGLIVLLLGSLITQRWGIDGILALKFGESSHLVTLTDQEILVFEEKGKGYELLGQKDFFPNKKISPKFFQEFFAKDFTTPELLQYLPSAKIEEDIAPSDYPFDPMAVQFRIKNPFVEEKRWVGFGNTIASSIDFGPATITFNRTSLARTNTDTLKNELIISPASADDFSQLSFAIYGRQNVKALQTGKIKVGETLSVPWMANFEFSVLQFLPRASVRYNVVRGNKNDQPALEMRWEKESRWLHLENPEYFDIQGRKFALQFARKRIPMKDAILLEEFKMDKYPGTNRAATYSSRVRTADGKAHVISMNEPLHHGDYVLYQSGFERDSQGNPYLSIFTVNLDPGRKAKYIGSLLIVLGMISMFYFKPKYSKKKRGTPS